VRKASPIIQEVQIRDIVKSGNSCSAFSHEIGLLVSLMHTFSCLMLIIMNLIFNYNKLRRSVKRVDCARSQTAESSIA